MNKNVLAVMSIALILLLFLVPAMSVSAAGKAPTVQAAWTFMVYLNGDNNLEKYVTADIEKELAQVGSNADVQVVVLADRIPGYSNAAGDWTTTKLFHVTQGMKATPSYAVADWGERNMGDPQTLIDFVQWAKAAYPADHYVLVFWDHGWGWRPDQTMSVALLDGLPAYRAAYDAAYAATQEVLDPTNKDLYDAAAEIKAHVPDPEIQARSQAVMDAVDAVVLYEGHRGKYHDAHGIGIFWPRLAADLDEPSSPQNDFEYYRHELAFSKWTDWDEFLNAYAAH